MLVRDVLMIGAMFAVSFPNTLRQTNIDSLIAVESRFIFNYAAHFREQGKMLPHG